MDSKKQEKQNRFEKRPARKLIGGVILLVVLSAIFAFYQFFSNVTAGAVNSLRTRSYQMKALSQSMIAECNEGDYFVVQRSLNRAIQELFEQNNIKIM